MKLPEFTLRELSHETILRWNNRNTHELLNIDFRYLRGRMGFACNNPGCDGLYLLDSIDEQPDKCVYCGVRKHYPLLIQH